MALDPRSLSSRHAREILREAQERLCRAVGRIDIRDAYRDLLAYGMSIPRAPGLLSIQSRISSEGAHIMDVTISAVNGGEEQITLTDGVVTYTEWIGPSPREYLNGMIGYGRSYIGGIPRQTMEQFAAGGTIRNDEPSEPTITNTGTIGASLPQNIDSLITTLEALVGRETVESMMRKAAQNKIKQQTEAQKEKEVFVEVKRHIRIRRKA